MRKFLFSFVLVLSLFILAKADVNAADNIFIGDSRTVMMYYATHPTDLDERTEIDVLDENNNYWRCKGATGFRYMEDYAFPAVSEYIEEGTNIFILFGVNDSYSLTNIDLYKKLFDEYIPDWNYMGANVYYVSVCPIRSDKTNYTNANVLAWNRHAYATFDWENMEYIDLYGGINQWAYTDSVHYTHACSKRMFNYLMREVGNEILIAKSGYISK